MGQLEIWHFKSGQKTSKTIRSAFGGRGNGFAMINYIDFKKKSKSNGIPKAANDRFLSLENAFLPPDLGRAVDFGRCDWLNLTSLKSAPFSANHACALAERLHPKNYSTLQLYIFAIKAWFLMNFFLLDQKCFQLFKISSSSEIIQSAAEI